MSSGWIIVGAILAFIVLLLAFGIYQVKRYLNRSTEEIQDTLGEIAEEIDSYQEKTQ